MNAARHAQHGVSPGRVVPLRTAALTLFGELGAWAYDTWIEHNACYFDGRLTPGPILWGLTPHGHALGFYDRGRNAITLHPSLIRPGASAWGIGALLGERYAADVLLHEMIHQKVHQLDGYAGAESHNCEPWCAEVNRLSAMLGLACKAAPIRQKRVDRKVTWFVEPGHLSRRQIATWPHGVRPAGYYEAAAADLLARNFE